MSVTHTLRPHPVPPIARFLEPRLTKTAWAREAGVHPSYVSRVVQGEVPASRKLRDAAVRLLGLPEEVLFGGRLDAGDRAS